MTKTVKKGTGNKIFLIIYKFMYVSFGRLTYIHIEIFDLKTGGNSILNTS